MCEFCENEKPLLNVCSSIGRSNAAEGATCIKQTEWHGETVGLPCMNIDDINTFKE